MKRKTLAHLAVLFLLVQVPSPLQAQDPDTLLVFARELFDQATSLYKEGQYTEAEELFLRALAIEEQEYGSDSPEVGRTLNSLGLTHHALGSYEEAYTVAARALAIREASLGPNHVDVAATLNNIGYIQSARGLYDEAQSALETSLDIYEAALGRDHVDVGPVLGNLASIYSDQGNYPEAEQLYRRVLDIRETALGPMHLDVAFSLNDLAFLLMGLGRYEEAEPLFNRSLAIQEAATGPDHPDVATPVGNLASLLRRLGRYAEAEEFFKRSLNIRESALGPDHPDVALTLNNLALLYSEDMGRHEEADPLYKRVVQIVEKSFGPNHPTLGIVLGNLASFYGGLARHEEAEPLLVRALEIRESALGLDHPDVVFALNGLASHYLALGRTRDVEPLLLRALGILEELPGTPLPVMGVILGNLAHIYSAQGNYPDAERFSKRSIEFDEALYGSDHPYMALRINNLGALYSELGRYSEAEQLLRRSLEIRQIALGPDHLDVAMTLNNLASLYRDQGRDAEAEPLLNRSLEIRETALGPEHPSVATALNNLAEFYGSDDPRAETHYMRSLQIDEASLGPDHPSVARTLANLATIYMNQGRYAEAESLFDRSITTMEVVLGPEHPTLGFYLMNVMMLYSNQSRWSDAERLSNRVVSIYDRVEGEPADRIRAYFLRSDLRSKLGDLPSALSDLEVALETLESLRPNLGGDDEVRAGFMEGYDSYFDRMVSWQVEAGEPEVALNWLERGRARVLLDQLAEAQIDLRSSIPEDELEPLEARETDARSRQATYQARITSLGSRSDLSTAERDERVTVLEDSLELADADYRQVYQDIKSASPLWQDLLTSGGEPVGLAEMQSELVPDDGLLLIYDINDIETSHVFVVPPEGEQLEVVSLDVTSESLDALVPRGAIRAADGSGGLSTLRGELFPDGLWDRVQGAGEVIVIPDGALHRLPFEALVVAGEGEEARYWLDDGPPVRYAASATALYNVERRSASIGSGVLSVSDPTFDLGDILRGERDREPVIKDRVDVVRAGFERAGGSFDRLPYTAEETEAIRTAFGSEEVVALQELDATERNVREAVGGDHRYLHLATHGLVDERRGSMYASLALTPVSGTNPEPEDDGFLELHEVYSLDLGSIALAVLSACETNVGESYAGEGMFALSRGFLAAGAQRVVATQWQVDDRATAVLIGHFFEVIAEAERAGEPVDYARALRDAKLEVRTDPDNPRWADPYYWAAFTITGQR